MKPRDRLGLTLVPTGLQSAAMPIYRYRCAACGAHEEHLQKISDPPIDTCATCGQPLSKLMTSAAFHLKGGGWYNDLYASAKPGDKKSDSATPSAGAESSDSGGSSSGGADSGGGASPAPSSSTPSSSSPSSAPASGSGSGNSSGSSSSNSAA
jgi:putative FmdB family regulatory protein